MACAVFVLAAAVVAQAQDPLPSWNHGSAKQAIIDFVDRVTTEGGPGFVPPAERIAVFDNDGTLWCEQPMYVQFAFVLDRVRELAPQHPEWNDAEPFKSILAGHPERAFAGGAKAMVELTTATHAGMTVDEFEGIARQWIAAARHPRFERPYSELVYQPMLELLAHLRARGFKTYIVSGGGVEFMRPWTEAVYGIPPEHVIGSSIELRYELQGGQPVIMRLPQVAFLNDKAGKPVGIHRAIGRRPIFAFGNSDGDFEMLDWTTAGEQSKPAPPSEPGRPRPRPNSRSRPSLALLVHHTDADREYAYDRNSHVGQLARGLNEAESRGWIVIDMKQDWKTVFPPPVPSGR
jgi:hypothetical protein